MPTLKVVEPRPREVTDGPRGGACIGSPDPGLESHVALGPLALRTHAPSSVKGVDRGDLKRACPLPGLFAVHSLLPNLGVRG